MTQIKHPDRGGDSQSIPSSARGLGKRTIGDTMYREFLSSLVEGFIDALAGYNELLIAVTYSRC
jgi:hypothetical protein